MLATLIIAGLVLTGGLILLRELHEREGRKLGLKGYRKS